MANVHRRQILLAGAAIAASSTIAPICRGASALRPLCGCCDRRRLFALGQSSTASISGLAVSSGDSTTDRFLGRALLRLATTFEIRPGFLFFEDTGVGFAFANSETLVQGTDGTVFMGKRLFREDMRLGDDGMTVIAVCAHEFGHIRQMRTGLMGLLGRLDKTVRPIELHADFLAGAFLAARKKDYPNLNLQAVGKTFFEFGDTDYASRDHHGTAQERIAAVSAGYEVGHDGVRDIDQISKAGIAFVKRIL